MKWDCTICVAKTKALISCALKLICTFGFAYADCWFSHEAAHLISCTKVLEREPIAMPVLNLDYYTANAWSVTLIFIDLVSHFYQEF